MRKKPRVIKDDRELKSEQKERKRFFSSVRTKRNRNERHTKCVTLGFVTMFVCLFEFKSNMTKIKVEKN